MFFWFGLEILRLVYRKAFFEILNGFYLIWPFILRKFLPNWAYWVSKEARFYADFKNVQKSCVWQKGGKNLQKNWIFRDLENLSENRFFWEKIFGNFLTQEFYTFLKSGQNSATTP